VTLEELPPSHVRHKLLQGGSTRVVSDSIVAMRELHMVAVSGGGVPEVVTAKTASPSEVEVTCGS